MTDRPTITIPFDVAAHVLWQAGRGGYPAGGYITALLTAWDRADDTHHARLSAAYPDYGASFDLLRRPGGIEQLRAIANP